MLLPSRYEGLPYVALEAQALGTVPVLTSVPGSCDAVVPGETAITTAFGDVDAMADAIVRLSDDSHLLTRMADKGRQFVEEKFSAESMTRAIEAMYGKVLSERIKARR
jgi:glycosyltransferase involved in cell wall biosynthesis